MLCLKCQSLEIKVWFKVLLYKSKYSTSSHDVVLNISMSAAGTLLCDTA